MLLNEKSLGGWDCGVQLWVYKVALSKGTLVYLRYKLL